MSRSTLLSRLPGALRRPGVLVAAGIALLLAVAVVLAVTLTGQAPVRPTAGDAPKPAPSGTASPAPTAMPTGEPGTPAPVLTEDEAEESVAQFFTASDAAAATPEEGLESLDEIATGAIRAELEAEYTELAAYGWSRHGSATLSDVKVLESDEQSARVQACVDVSDVVIKDAEGEPIPSAADVGTPRSLHIFTLEFDGADWRLAARDFPTDPSC